LEAVKAPEMIDQENPQLSSKDKETFLRPVPERKEEKVERWTHQR
jgi:hypothetical protein